MAWKLTARRAIASSRRCAMRVATGMMAAGMETPAATLMPQLPCACARNRRLPVRSYCFHLMFLFILLHGRNSVREPLSVQSFRQSTM